MGARSDLDSNFDYEIIDEFLDHYAIMVDSMEIMILDLSNQKRYERSINELFRVFHNIKSASGFLQIEQMSRLATYVEEILEELRKINKPVNDDVINWLLKISDMFATWNDDLKADNNLSHVKYTLLKTPDLEKYN
ncbi:MAG: chemotaxis protein CheA [Sulfurimonas sp.]|nr:MAG: chemotaxis protein CheA [Sulfurimonas sp.]